MTTVEMSRYIDLLEYDKVEPTHPFYREMIDEIAKHVRARRPSRILEIGTGTGLLTQKLSRMPKSHIDAVDIDTNCCNFIKAKFKTETRVQVINCDAVTYLSKKPYDIIVSSFSHDHIPYEKRFEFSLNISKNLKQDGVYIMGNEILPQFKTEMERKEALRKYHGFIIWKAITDSHEKLASLELESLNSGLKKIGDFKRHEKMLEEEMASSGLEVLLKKKIGPKENIGGVFVYVFKKIIR